MRVQQALAGALASPAAAVRPARPRRRHPRTACRAKLTEGNPLITASVNLATSAVNLFSARDSSADAAEPGERPADTAELQQRLEAEYREHQYFVTGEVDLSLYSPDCTFADPTLSFRGAKRYKRNLQNLKAFFLDPSIELRSLERLQDSSPPALQARWRLRVQLRLPWRPLIDIGGTTEYTLDASGTQIVTHVERWEVSAADALKQLFKPQPKRS